MAILSNLERDWFGNTYLSHDIVVNIMEVKAKIVLSLAWIQAVVAMGGSLFFSEVLHWTPCVLCWYQRICMYPLALLLVIAILRKDQKIWMYVLPLASIGWCIALYHNLLQWGIISEALAPCTNGVSCTTRYAGWFGFITIPLLSFIAFSCIIVCMWLYRRWQIR